MYERFCELLRIYDVSAYRVAKDTGISQQTMTDWKHGKSEPKLDKLKKIADYFNVPVAYFLETEEENGPIYVDKDTKEIVDMLRQRPVMKTLFMKSKNATNEDLEMVVDIIDRFAKTNPD